MKLEWRKSASGNILTNIEGGMEFKLEACMGRRYFDLFVSFMLPVLLRLFILKVQPYTDFC